MRLVSQGIRPGHSVKIVLFRQNVCLLFIGTYIFVLALAWITGRCRPAGKARNVRRRSRAAPEVIGGSVHGDPL